jgi:hypothetical protein
MLVIGEDASHLNWLGYALTGLGLFISVWLVLLQLGRQHRSSLKLQRKSAREELKLKVYETLSAKAQAFSEANTQLSTYVRMIPFALESYAAQVREGIDPRMDREAAHLLELSTACGTALVELVVAIEAWEIAFPSAKLFKTALGCGQHDVDASFHPFFVAVLPFLSSDIRPLPPAVEAEQLDAIKGQANSFLQALDEIRCYSYDLTVEAQNQLLSKLFKRKVEVRQPIDPACKVITFENAEALMRYFVEESEAGRGNLSAQEEVRQHVRQRGEVPLN